MIFDPYAVLEIERSATTAGIKAAYRRRVRATHPDIARTADAAAFQDVVKAHAILSDPVRKKRFDDTGTVDDFDPLEEQKAAMGVLAGLFEKMLEQASQAKKRLATLNFIDGLCMMIDGNTADAVAKIDDLRAQIDERLALKGRITRKSDGPNLFADKLTRQIESLSSEMADQHQRLRILRVAHTELGNYKNEVEMVAAFQTMFYGYASSSGSSSFNVTRVWPT